MNRILVLRGGALGDFIVTLPALALLRNRWLKARIELVGNAEAAVLALDADLLDSATSQHAAIWSALYGSGPLPAALAERLASFDLVLNFWPDPDGSLKRHFPLRAGQIFLSGPALPARGPAAAHYCEPLRALGLQPREMRYSLAEPAAASHRIAVHPGSGSPRKNWPIARWASLCAWLKSEYNAEPLIVTGPADDAAALACFGREAHRLPLAALRDELRQCRLFLGHDSGVSHLAAACHTPCVLLFGPTDASIWAPPGNHVHVVQRGSDLADIALEHVQHTISRALIEHAIPARQE